LVPAPLRPRHDRIEVRHLVPVLHVDGEAVDRRGGGGHRATATIARRRETSDAAAARPRVETPWRPARELAPGDAALAEQRGEVVVQHQAGAGHRSEPAAAEAWTQG